MNCHLMQDMLTFLESNNPNDHKARLFSTHSTILQLILVTFGAFEDATPLTRHNFAQQVNRLWKSSLVAPMGTNLAVIRFEWVISVNLSSTNPQNSLRSCPDGDNDVLFLFNEKPLQIDGCQSNGLCKQSLIVERFSRFLSATCTDVFCRN